MNVIDTFLSFVISKRKGNVRVGVMDAAQIGTFMIQNAPGGALSIFLFYLYMNEKKLREKLTVDIIEIYKEIANSNNGGD